MERQTIPEVSFSIESSTRTPSFPAFSIAIQVSAVLPHGGVKLPISRELGNLP